MTIQCPLDSEMMSHERRHVIDYPSKIDREILRWAADIMMKAGLGIFANKRLNSNEVVSYIVKNFPYEEQSGEQ